MYNIYAINKHKPWNEDLKNKIPNSIRYNEQTNLYSMVS